MPTSPATAHAENGIHTEPASRHASAAANPPSDTRSPADRYEELFVAVQSARIFEDCKAFVDCAPLKAPDEILADYRAMRDDPDFDLGTFVKRHFATQHAAAAGYRPAPGQTMAQHIDGLWSELTRHPSHHPHRGSLLRLPHRYVVPGGRFVEMYYWDSYFTMLGLAESGEHALLHAMTDNFAYLIETYGHVPNGTRTYYLSRSQPPVFALMTQLCESCKGQGAARYLPQLLREHAFWMDGASKLAPGEAHRRVVALPDGTLLNRYWDDRDTPREESWRDDIDTASRSDRPAAEVCRDLRAAAESGWDFSSRWLAPGVPKSADRLDALSTIRTTRILPVDLNALMHRLETTIAQLSVGIGDMRQARLFEDQAASRAKGIGKWLWNAEAGAFLDHDWQDGRPRTALNAATVTPLFTGTATPEQASALAATVRRRLLAPGGLATTETESSEQWDRPNGWAPLQWIAVEGLRRYGEDALASEIRRRWLDTVQEVYDREGKLVEKYALRPTETASCTGGDGGEYPLQDGFGWTNGVVRPWLAE
ncbi:MAG: alpha,alpha-trehalase TreF [Variovorax sp.]|nr:MAG: alpha,alpha-trehalase TreF [Variovorax sp.]